MEDEILDLFKLYEHLGIPEFDRPYFESCYGKTDETEPFLDRLEAGRKGHSGVVRQGIPSLQAAYLACSLQPFLPEMNELENTRVMQVIYCMARALIEDELRYREEISR